MLLRESLQKTFDCKNFLELLDACKHYMFMANKIDPNFLLIISTEDDYIAIQKAMGLFNSVELMTSAVKDYNAAILHKYPEIQSNGWTLEHYEDYIWPAWYDREWEEVDNLPVIRMFLERFGEICQFGQNHWSSDCQWEIVYPALHNWSFYFQSEYLLNCFIKTYIRNPEQIRIFRLENNDRKELHQEKEEIVGPTF